MFIGKLPVLVAVWHGGRKAHTFVIVLFGRLGEKLEEKGRKA